MPTYEYRCQSCGDQFEIVQSFSDASLKACEKCTGELRKVYGNVGISFKGSGFYKNDARTGSSNGSSVSSGSGSSESSSSSGSTDSGSGSSATPSSSTDSSSSSGSNGGSSGSSSGSSDSGSSGSSHGAAAPAPASK